MNTTETDAVRERPGLVLTPRTDARRQAVKVLGRANAAGQATQRVGLTVAASRQHIHCIGVTGAGKSTQLLNLALAEAQAGRGLALVDPKGDLASDLLERLPADAGQRLVIVDPAETQAPPSLNVLDTSGRGAELVAEHIVGVLSRLYAAAWGPRIDDTLRAACLTLARYHPGATLADIPPLLTNSAFRQRLAAKIGRRDSAGLAGFWAAYDQMSPAEMTRACGPVLSKLRAVFTRSFVADLFGNTASTFRMRDILDGGILIARLPKGVLGEDGTRLVGAMLLSGLWQAAMARAAMPEPARADATVIVDECHNFLHLPIGLEDAMAEARGLRVSFVLAHQHLGQLPTVMHEAIMANARTKIVFTVAPADATELIKHLGPYLTAEDLARLPRYTAAVRLVTAGADTYGFTIATLPAPPTVPGRAAQLRVAARARGLTVGQRADARRKRLFDIHKGQSTLGRGGGVDSLDQ